MNHWSWVIVGGTFLAACTADGPAVDNEPPGDVVRLSDLAQCTSGQVIQKTDTGWACADIVLPGSSEAGEIQAGEGIRVQSQDSAVRVSVNFLPVQGDVEGQASSVARSDHKTRWVDMLNVPQQVRALASLQSNQCAAGNLLKRTSENNGWECGDDALEVAAETCNAGEFVLRNESDNGWVCQAPTRVPVLPTCAVNEEIKPTSSGDGWECVDKAIKTSISWAGGNCWEVDNNADPVLENLSTVTNLTKKSCDTNLISLTETSTVRVFLDAVPDKATITEWGMWVGIQGTSDEQLPQWECSLCRGHKEASEEADCLEESIEWKNLNASNWEYVLNNNQINYATDNYKGFELLEIKHLPGWTVICEPRCAGDSCSGEPPRHLIHSVFLRYYDN